MTVFARTTDDAMASLVKKLDTSVGQHRKHKLAAIVAFVGSDRATILADVDQFQAKHSFKNVVLAVPKDHEQGVRGLNLNPKAAATVLFYRDKKIRVNRVVVAGGIDPSFVDAMASDIETVALEKPSASSSASR